MLDIPVDVRDGDAIGAEGLLARAARADARNRRATRVAIDDLMLGDAGRIEDSIRVATWRLAGRLVAAVEADLSHHGARLLAARGDAPLAALLSAARGQSLDHIRDAGLLRDEALLTELIGRVREQALAAALPVQAPETSERASLLTRLAEDPDAMVAASANAVLVADSRRRADGADERAAAVDLPAELYHRLVWWVAAALRHQAAGASAPAALDQALCDAALRCLAAYDEGERLEAAALRLALALNADEAMLARLLGEAIADRQLTLFVALLAQAIGIDYADARALVLDASSERLLIALRAFGIPQPLIARIGYALWEADRRRSMEDLARMIDEVHALDLDDARAAVAAIRLPRDYRAAQTILAMQDRLP